MWNINFREALRRLTDQYGSDVQFRLANGARQPSSYVLNAILPPRRVQSYDAKAGTMKVQATMAGLVGMDSPYPPVGHMESTTWSEQTAKIAAQMYLPEGLLRELQEVAKLSFMPNSNVDSAQATVDTLLNFQQLILLQSLYDTEEYLRGEALSTGAIDWTFGKIRLQVDYGVPAANLFAQRTGTARYNGSASVFWADLIEADRLLGQKVRVRLARSATINAIIGQAANNIEVIRLEANGSAEFIRTVVRGGLTVRSSDARERVTIIAYDGEGSVVVPATPGVLANIPFIPEGKIINIGNPIPRGMQITAGRGSQEENVQSEFSIGYTHIAPTVENGGRAGYYTETLVPEMTPWSLFGRCAANLLPVIEGPDRLVVMDTALA